MWNKLSMKDRAEYIKLGVANGITDLSTIRGAYNKYAEGGFISNDSPPENNGFLGLSGDQWADIGTSMIPVYGTYKDAKEFYHNPSWENAGWLAVSALSEIPFLKWLKAGKATKAVRAVNKATQAAESYSRAKRTVNRMREIPNIKPSRISRASGEAGRAYQQMMITTGEALRAKRAAEYFKLHPEQSIVVGTLSDYIQGLEGTSNTYNPGFGVLAPPKK